MTIKEIEERTGLPRASIRFYEKEGLLSPQRQENGYRIYSDGDLEQLKKLKLLRALGLSLEEIRQAMEGKARLCALLRQRTEAIGQEQEQLQNADRVCCRMYREQVAYETLDADRYLQDLQQTPVPETDVLPRVRCPWQRFFARYLDGLLYLTLYTGFLTLTTQVCLFSDSTGFQLLQWLAELILLLVLEPVLLHFFGTTPGKWIFGLSVTGPEGGRLSWASALDRTFFMLRDGQGFRIPFYSLYRHYRSFRDCENGEPLSWESDSLLGKEDHPLRAWVLVPLTMVLVLLLQLSFFYIQSVPDLRGDLTVEDFSRNYNQMVRCQAGNSGQKLGTDGLWLDPAEDGSGPIVYGIPQEQADFQYTLDRGTLTGIRLELQVRSHEWTGAMLQERDLAVSAFVRARHGLSPLGDETELVRKKLEEDPFGSWQVTANGITVTNQARLRGYTYLDELGLLVPESDSPGELSLVFTMEKAR